ncbi:hypothetical protein ACFY93_12025 [Streptomyces sp. NPDC008313]|uniref:hypothetical protein n=1 Tax=Streptomyces sp. NPDC008313 TaxID=3364826 RepID=UPI0036E3050E
MPADEYTPSDLRPARTRAAGRLPSAVDALTVVFSGPRPGTADTRAVVPARIAGRMWVAEAPGAYERVSYRTRHGHVTHVLG